LVTARQLVARIYEDNSDSLDKFSAYFERVTDVVYHATDLYCFNGILSQNAFRCSPVEKEQGDVKDYQFSVSRAKQGGYTHRSQNRLKVMLVLDGEKLSHRYKAKAVDFFSGADARKIDFRVEPARKFFDFTEDGEYVVVPVSKDRQGKETTGDPTGPVFTSQDKAQEYIHKLMNIQAKKSGSNAHRAKGSSEVEDRLWSDKQFIPNASSYIKEVHVYADDSNESLTALNVAMSKAKGLRVFVYGAGQSRNFEALNTHKSEPEEAVNRWLKKEFAKNPDLDKKLNKAKQVWADQAKKKQELINKHKDDNKDGAGRTRAQKPTSHNLLPTGVHKSSTGSGYLWKDSEGKFGGPFDSEQEAKLGYKKHLQKQKMAK
jgi:hypothetical protein